MKLIYTCTVLLAGSQAKNCLSGQGRDYDGRVSTTRSGFTCMRWTRGYPHRPNTKVALAIRREGVNNYNHNFCRNPGGVLAQPWCYTTHPYKRYDYCELPVCEATDDDDDDDGRSGGKNCLSGIGKDYTGKVSTTPDGSTCINWLQIKGARNTHAAWAIPNNANHNYCRNYDNDQRGPWCYINMMGDYKFCDLPKCGSNGKEDCLSGIGTNYNGKISTTPDSRTCINWLVMKNIRYTSATRAIPNNANHNYCRNFDSDQNGPWCYVNTNGEYKFCDIPKCGSDKGGTTKPQIEDDDDDANGGGISPSACGYKNNRQSMQGRIVGGVVADKGEWPWQVHLRKYGGGFCGGSIINEYFILTAAHCADKDIVPDKRELKIAVGWNFYQGTLRSISSEDRARGKDYIGVRNIFVHPKWGGSKGPLTDDIALIELERPVRFVQNGLVRPVCLPSKAWEDYKRADDECTATGWGANDNFGDPRNPVPQKELDSKLLEVELDAKDGARPGYPGLIGGKAPKYFRSGVCFGDSGGPFVCSSKSEKERQVQVGLSSYVTDGTYTDYQTGQQHHTTCGNDTPSMFTKVSEYLDWIKGYAGEVQVMDENGDVIG